MEDLWCKIKELTEEKSLVQLFLTLIDNHENILWCDEFLGFLLTKELTTDEVVHTLNALGPIKNQLENWCGFREYGFDIIRKKYDSDTAEKMIKFITT
jgi:hypothetical protein